MNNFILLILFLLVTGCTTIPTVSSSLAHADGTGALQETLAAPEPKTPHFETITLTATGDIPGEYSEP